MAGSLHLLDQTSRECRLPRTGMKTWMRLSAKSAVSSALHHSTGHASVLGGSAAQVSTGGIQAGDVIATEEEPME